MLKPLRCDFMTGPLTDQHSMELLSHALEQQTPSIHEMLYYKKNGTGIWLEVGILHLTNTTKNSKCDSSLTYCIFKVRVDSGEK